MRSITLVFVSVLVAAVGNLCCAGPGPGQPDAAVPVRDGSDLPAPAVDGADGPVAPDGGGLPLDGGPAPDAAFGPSCTDGKKNQTETDVDCGGPCGGCADGKACLVPADCLSGYCHTDQHCAENPLAADGCFKWPAKLSPTTTLLDAVTLHSCVEVQAGTYTIDKPLGLKPGHTLRGVGAAQSILKASQAAWAFNCCDAMAQDTLPSNPALNPFKVSKLTLDGGGVATYNVCCRGYLVEDSTLTSSRCSAIGIAGTGVVARNNQMLASAQPTQVPGRGTVSCATGGFGGVAEGAAIYSQGTASDYGSLIEDNTIKGSYGPALDINGAWGGVFRNNTVSGNSGWAAVSLYGASNWTVEGNTISHPANEPPQPYHPYCATGPAGGNSAGIFLCQDTDAGNLVTNGNKIVNNHASSFYGILSVGADEIKAYWAPRNNTFTGNDVFGSQVGCADDFKPGQWLSDANVWSNNNCGGQPNTGPTFF